MKGAPELFLDSCAYQLNKEGVIESLFDEDKTQILAKVKQMAQKTLRCILVAYCEYGVEEWQAISQGKDFAANQEDQNAIERNLVIAGLFGLKDPLRFGIETAVKRC